MGKIHPLVLLVLLIIVLPACSVYQSPDDKLRTLLQEREITALDPGPAPDAAKVALGQALFFDKVISGNRDIACATCHHPVENSGDGISVSIGTGGSGLGKERQIGYNREFIPRNAPEIFNRGAAEWTTMFWDSRVAVIDGQLVTPAGEQLPDGLDNILAAQALFPVTSGDEMRGAGGDRDIHGQLNELADIDENNLTAIWDGLMDRLLQYPGYVALFQAAYPDVSVADLTFAHAANAIAAFEIEAYTLANSPWQQYLRGDHEALSKDEKRGAILFYGVAGCANCHSGSLMTNQQHYALATPQVGPGKGDSAPLDLGRFLITQEEADLYAFRVPSLHNVTTSGPWMHDGAFSTLESVILHHLDPDLSLRTYDPAEHLPHALQDTFQNDPNLIADMLSRVDPLVKPVRRLTHNEVKDLVAFLHALTDPAVEDLESFVPPQVPSGLSVEEMPLQDAN